MEEVKKSIIHKCSRCEDVVRFKFLKKINGERLCHTCYKDNRHSHRKETIEEAGIGEELKELKNKIKTEWNQKNPEKTRASWIKSYEKKMGRPVKHYNKDKSYQPIIKGTTRAKPIHSYNLFLSIQEKQLLFKFLRRRGMDDEEAKERIQNLIDEQQRVGKLIKEKNKSESEIKQKQQQLFEELWR